MEEQMKEELQIQKIEELSKKINEVLDLGETEELLKSNEKIFEVEGVTYRVRKPIYKERRELYQKRLEKFTELLNNEKYALEDSLKKMYKKRDIDIDALSLEIANKLKRRNELMFQLGELIKNNAPEADLEKFKNEILNLQNDVRSISIQKTQLLEYSIENQVLIYIYGYLTFLISEKKEGDNWVRVWNSFEDFQNDLSALANQLSFYSAYIGNVD